MAPNYKASTDFSCVDATGLIGCLQATSTTVCVKCSSEYFLLDGECVLVDSTKNITATQNTECLEWTEGAAATDFICKYCVGNKKIVTTGIVKGTDTYYPCDQAAAIVPNCLKWNNKAAAGAECEGCDNGFSLAANACSALANFDVNCASNNGGAACV